MDTIKAIGSKINLNVFDNEITLDYYDCVKDLINTKQVQQLMDYEQHADVNRFQHSLNVSYYSFLLCKKLRLDYRSAARGGLLHDLFFYHWSDTNAPSGWHVIEHPKQALRNAQEVAGLSQCEREIISKHMWPFCAVPRFFETHIVSLIDKYCAFCEAADSVWIRIRLKGRRVFAFDSK